MSVHVCMHACICMEAFKQKWVISRFLFSILAVAQSVSFARGLKATEFVYLSGLHQTEPSVIWIEELVTHYQC
jgi:hypothetical protein